MIIHLFIFDQISTCNCRYHIKKYHLEPKPKCEEDVLSAYAPLPAATADLNKGIPIGPQRESFSSFLNMLRSLAAATSAVSCADCNVADELIFVPAASESAVGSETDEMDLAAAVKGKLESLLNVLQSNNFCARNIFYMHFLLASMGTFASANSVYSETFNFPNPPSRACVEVPLESAPVIADCMAYNGTRQVLHVQSISRWAPSCIGPYSQASRFAGITFLAGVIGLDPATMGVIHDVENQVRQTWWNCSQVLHVEGSSLENCVSCVVFLSAAFGSSTLEKAISSSNTIGAPARVPISYVIVPTLPKNLMIEVQLVGHESRRGQLWDKSRRFSHSCFTSTDGLIYVQEDGLQLQSLFCSSRFVLLATPQKEISTSPSLALLALATAVVQRAAKAQITWNKLFTLRIYYIHWLNEDIQVAVNAAFAEALKGAHTSILAVLVCLRNIVMMFIHEIFITFPLLVRYRFQSSSYLLRSRHQSRMWAMHLGQCGK